jgi:BirA family transcriptional regulator, biotin operon repressor / biotin---[acetyl-CoA-carboxylase] ligase
MGAQNHGIMLPAGHRALYLAETSSTNAHAMRLACEGAPPPQWVWAGRQTRGRGRLGRAWDSPQGNLYASLFIAPDCPVAMISGLPLLAGLAAYDAISEFAAITDLADRLRLKWPNDILLDNAKLGGVLIESAMIAQGQQAVVIGTGLNLAAAPSGLDRAVTCLRDHGVNASPADALGALSCAAEAWLAVWANGTGFNEIRSAWLARAHPLGAGISVWFGDERVEGRFAGVDDTGALRLSVDGGERRITAGDVAITENAPVAEV